MKPLVLFGTGGLTQVVAEYIGEQVAAFTVDSDYIKLLSLGGIPVVPFEELSFSYIPDEFDLLVVVTQQNRHRTLLEQKMREGWEKGYATPSFVHPAAIVAESVSMGQNCIVGPGAILEPGATLGNGVIVRSGAYIGHHSHLGCCSYIAPRASMSGYVQVGNGAFIGNNSTIRDQTIIGHGSVVGAGAVVLRDVKPGEVYRGYPARLLSISGEEIEI